MVKTSKMCSLMARPNLGNAQQVSGRQLDVKIVKAVQMGIVKLLISRLIVTFLFRW